MSEDDVERRLRADPTGDRAFPIDALHMKLLGSQPTQTRRPPRSILWRMADIGASLALVVSLVWAIGLQPANDDPAARLPESFRRSGQMTVVVTDRSPQLIVAGRLQGFDVDVAEEIGRHLGLRVRIEASDQTLMSAGAIDRPWDLALGIRRSPGASSGASVDGVAYYYRRSAVVVPAGTAPQGLSDLTGKIVCAVSGSTSQAWATGNFGGAMPPATGLAVVLAPTVDACLVEIARGTVAGAVVDFDYDVSGIGKDLTVLDEYPFVTEGFPIFSSATSEARELGPVVEEVLRGLRTDGTLARLSKHRFGGLDLTVPP